MLRRGVVEDRIGIVTGSLHLADHSQLVEIEDRHRARASVADEAATQIGRDRDAMYAFSFRNRSDDFLMIDVDDFDAIAVRDIESVRRAVDGQVVPPTRSPDRNVPNDVVGGAELRRENESEDKCDLLHGAYATPALAICATYTPPVNFAAALLACTLISVPVEAAEEGAVRRAAEAVAAEARQYGRDLKAEVLAPAHWNRTEWERAALVVGTVTVLMHEDEHIARSIQARRNSRTNSIARAVTPIGGGRGLQLSAAMVLAGLLARNDGLRDTGRDAFESQILAAGVITPLLKKGFGRQRPNQDEMNSHDFDPGSTQDSFPSGHSTSAFALASAIAGHSDGWIVPTVAYTVASSVAVARLNDNVHWASDVFAGAVIGTATGRMIARRHRAAAHTAEWSMVPIIADRRVGFLMRVTTR
jgi:membrane-associated phospholipid phosphatase